MCRTVWMWLLILAVLPLFCESEEERNGPRCCRKCTRIIISNIKECYEQKPTEECNFRAFRIITEDNEVFCLAPDSPWLQRRIEEGNVECPAIMTETERRVEVLNKVDME